jgi:hypothetical protein
VPISEVLSIPLILAVSYLGARLVGDNWAETKALGDTQRTMEWTTGILSAVGFSYAYVLFVVLALEKSGHLSPGAALQVTHIGYGFLAFPALGALAVSVHHVWLTRMRRSAASNADEAEFLVNLYSNYLDWTFWPEVDLSRVFGGGSGGGGGGGGGDFSLDGEAIGPLMLFALAMLVVCAAVAGGVVTAVIIVRHRTRVHSARMVERLRPVAMPVLQPHPVPLARRP